MPSRLHLTIHGARGSTPVAGEHTDRYGGRTTCFGLDVSSESTVIFDCGTGMAFAPELLSMAPVHYHIFITHYHYDHLQGLQFFRPLYEPQHQFTFYGHRVDSMSLAEAIGGVFRPPWFPVSLDDTLADKNFVELDGEPHFIDGVEIRSTSLRHPQGVSAFRVDHEGKSIVIATDHEAGDEEFDQRLVDFASGATTLIHDAQYTPEEYEDQFVGWGHSTWKGAVATATAAGVDRLVLTSHHPFRSDGDIDAILGEARIEFPRTDAAYEGMQIPI
jgi:phosphoribosyl 1,2-cyclic phosphodiesterase